MPRSSLFASAGSLQADYERIDWAATPVGPEAAWSAPLRSTLSLALATRFPVTLLWGPELLLLYNEAYVQLIADKHPSALGSPARAVFPEAWDTIGPMLTGVLDGAGSTWVEDQRLLLHRRGLLEECFFTFSYSPVTDGHRRVVGVLDIAAETTTQVVDRRRLELLTVLGERLHALVSPDGLRDLVLPVLRAAAADVAAVDVVRGGGVSPVLRCGPPAGAARTAVALQEVPDGTVAWLPLDAGVFATERFDLGVRLSPHLAPDRRYLAFLELVAAALGSALSLAAARAAELAAAASSRSMSEVLQRSMLTAPPLSEDVELAVRYLPAAQDARIGGDWYDAFSTSDGRLCLVVGDVAGHDQQAAASMGQIRNLLRGIGHTVGQPPAAVLTLLDCAVRDLRVGALATCVLALVDPPDATRPPGVRVLRWSNAGHPPPLLLHADGTAALLDTPPDLLLGLDATAARGDHTAVLPPGATVLLYTDGLFERRGTDLDDGLRWLQDTAAGLVGRSLDELCDGLLQEVEGHSEDDVVLLALRARPGDAAGASGQGPAGS